MLSIGNTKCGDGDLNVCPNPVQDILNFQIDNRTIGCVEVFNINGQLIENYSPVEAIDIRGLKVRIYFVEVTYGTGAQESSRIFKED